MTAAAVNYARVLYELKIPESSVQKTEELMEMLPEFGSVLKNPLVPMEAKERVIDRIIPEEMKNFMKVACRHHKAELFGEIFEAYEELRRKEEGILKAVLRYVTPPRQDQLEGIREFLCREFQVQKAEIELREDKSLIGGFILQAGGQEYDWSLRGRYRRLKQKLTRR